MGLPALILMIALATAAPIHAEEEPIEEAQGLGESPEVKAPESSGWREKLRYRSYLLAEGLVRKNRIRNKTDLAFPQAELSFSGVLDLSTDVQPFLDAIGTYSKLTNELGFHLNQTGVRYRPTDSLLFMAGKERNRRAPGLIVSPSDFIHTNQSFPGTREDRTGVWQARVAYQREKDSVDIAYLPFSGTDKYGLPTVVGTSNVVGRYFKQTGPFDLGLSVGYIDDSWKIGASAQGIFRSVWKLYVEGGFETKKRNVLPKHDAWSLLIGAGYEASDKIIPRLELYRNGATLTATEIASLPPLANPQPFLRTWYAVASLSFLDVIRDINLVPSAIVSLEDSGSLFVLRGEWLAGQSHVLGTTFIAINTSAGNQYRLAPIDWQLTADWKWSF